MQVKGKIWKEDNFWIAEIKALDLVTEAKSKSMALDNFLNLIEEKYTLEKENYIIKEMNNSFFLEARETRLMVPLILKGLRNAECLSISEVASRLGFKGRSSYSKYESGERAISIDSFEKIVKAITDKKILFNLI